MKKPAQKKEFAEGIAKKLPGKAFPESRDQAVGGVNPALSRNESHIRSEIPVRATELGLFSVASVNGESREGLVEKGTGAPKFSTAHLRPADQLLLHLSQRVMELRHLRSHSMSVVIKPDADTEISLRLVKRDGYIDMAARLHRGDLESLKEQWGELQRHLHQNGIRLGALHTAQLQEDTPQQRQSGLFDFHQGQFSGRRRDRNEESAQDAPNWKEDTEDETKDRRTRVKAKRWESWA